MQNNIEEIYKDNFNVVKKYLFCLTHDNDISEELTQETFYKAMKNLDKFQGNCKLSVWLCQIAKNLWYNKLKKEKKVKEIPQQELFSIEMIEQIEDNIVKNEAKIKLYKRMQLLDDLTREVIYLRITGELSFKEIAYILNKTENWARVTFYRGKEKLKEVNCYEE